MTITWRRGSPIRLTSRKATTKAGIQREFQKSRGGSERGESRANAPRRSPTKAPLRIDELASIASAEMWGRGDPLRGTRGVRQASLPIPPGEQGALYLNRIQLEEFAKSVEREDGFLSRGLDPLNRF
jgi:hypothetical protein